MLEKAKNCQKLLEITWKTEFFLIKIKNKSIKESGNQEKVKKSSSECGK